MTTIDVHCVRISPTALPVTTIRREQWRHWILFVNHILVRFDAPISYFVRLYHVADDNLRKVKIRHHLYGGYVFEFRILTVCTSGFCRSSTFDNFGTRAYWRMFYFQKYDLCYDK